jgi:hypothetical protein
MELREYALANGFVQSFQPHSLIGYAYSESLESQSKLDRYNDFLDEAKRILKCKKLEYKDGIMLADKKTSKAARERFWYFCKGLDHADYFME